MRLIYNQQKTTIQNHQQMQPNNQINLTKDHLEVLQYLDNLFTRWSLRRNSYLFKHMKSSLQIPLFIIAQERRIAQITQSQSIIIQFQALKLCEFVQVNQQSRVVVILDLPTLKFQDQSNMIKMQNIVKIQIKQKASQDKSNVVKPLEYIISSKTQDGFFYITLKTKKPEDTNLLKQLAQKYNKQNQQKIKYIQEPLYDDIKQSVTKLRKSRNPNYSNNLNTNRYNYNDAHDKNNKNPPRNDSQINMPVYSRQNMMGMYPNAYYSTYNSMTPEQINMYMMQTQQHQQAVNSPGPFIRKAIESQDEQQNIKTEKNRTEEEQSNKNSKQTKQMLEQSSESNQNNKKTSVNQNTNSYSTQSSTSTGWKNNQKKYEQKNNQHKKKNVNQKQKKQDKKQQKGPKSKVVLDDNDFPSIG